MHLDPGHAACLNLAGMDLHKAGRLDKTLEAFDRAIRVSPEFSWPRANRAGVLEHRGEIEKAKEGYRSAGHLYPKHPGAFLALARIFEAEGDHASALASTLEAIELAPEHARAHSRAVRVLRERARELPAASWNGLQERLQASAPEPASPVFLNTRAVAALLQPGLEDPEGAMAFLLAAVDSGERSLRVRGALLETIEELMAALDGPAAEKLAAARAALEPRGDALGEDATEVLATVAAGRPLRINCGGGDLELAGGESWSADAFFLAGQASSPWRGEVAGTERDALYHSSRCFGEHEGALSGYRVPLAPGEYRVTLHFCELTTCEPGARRFDVFIEGRRVLPGYEPLVAGLWAADHRRFEGIEVSDGILDIRFAARWGDPCIAAIEVETR